MQECRLILRRIDWNLFVNETGLLYYTSHKIFIFANASMNKENMRQYGFDEQSKPAVYGNLFF